MSNEKTTNEKITNAILNIQYIFKLNKKNIKTGTTLVEARMRTSFNQIKNINQSYLNKKNKFSLNRLIEKVVLPTIKIDDSHIFLPESVYQAMKLQGQQLKLRDLKKYTKTSCPMLAFYVVIAYANRRGALPNIAEKIQRYFSQVQALANNIFANTNAENNQQLIEAETKLLQDTLSENHLKKGAEIRRHYIPDDQLDVDKTSEMFNRWVWLVAITQFLANKWPQSRSIAGKEDRKISAITNIELLLTSDYAYYKEHNPKHLSDYLNNDPITQSSLEVSMSANSTNPTIWVAQLLSTHGLFAAEERPNNHNTSDFASKIEEKDVYTEYKF
ncbi:MAG: hypothetical protein V4471_07290 [Pseudomonadota bacterium]